MASQVTKLVTTSADTTKFTVMPSTCKSKVSPNMLTFASVADDLAAYRRYLDDEETAEAAAPAAPVAGGVQ